MIFRTVALATLACLAASVAARADVSSAQRGYEAVLRHMASLPEPATLRYRAHITSRNGNFLVGRDLVAQTLQFGFAIGGEPQPLDVPVTAFQGRIGTTVDLDRPATTTYPLLDATWEGSYDWLRYGFDGPPQASIAPTPPGHDPAPSDAPLDGPVVAVVRAIGIGSYAIEDRGPQACPDGRPGYHVRLHARRDADAHPATDAVFDPATQTMCSLRFDLRPGQFLHVPGSVELSYAPHGRYVVATGARIEFWGTIHHVGRNHIEIAVQYGQFS